MATKTKYYQLTRPEATDYYDITVYNENLDKIGEIMSENGTNIETINTRIDELTVDGLDDGTNYVRMSTEERTKLAGVATGANKTTVDSTLKSTSTNPVQNKIVYSALSGKANSSHTHTLDDIEDKGTNGYILTANGSDTAPSWKAPILYTGTGEYSIISTRGDETGQNIASARQAIAIQGGQGRYYNTASGRYSLALGAATIASGVCSVAGGTVTEALGDCSFVMGMATTGNNAQTVFGRANIPSSGPTASSDTTGDLFIIGCGYSNVDGGWFSGKNTEDNAFRISAAGTCYGKTSFSASGADFAEYFEWTDGNTENEDRRGLFVTLDGEKIRIANAADEYILGAVSAVPTVTGDTQSEVWKDMYLTDVFGARITETVEVAESADEDSNVIAAHTETRFKINPEYDNTKEYQSRDKRQEWAAVGLVGKLIVVDDGSCEVNGYCNAGDGGIATKADTGYRVMSRIDDTHIKILL